MSVRNAGKAIREARLKAGLTQEKLSDGICSVLSLSRIENCSANVSPSTFRALMSRAGADCEALPTFASRTDFDCFYTLKRARYYLEAWQFEDAYKQLQIAEKLNWADNRFYYQEWLLLQYRIQFYNNNQNHQQLYDLLVNAISISCSRFSIDNINSLLLSTVEIELILCLAQECLYLNRYDDCHYVCVQINSYLTNSQFTSLEKERLLAQWAIIYIKYLIIAKDYTSALEVAESSRHQMVLNREISLLYELTFLSALGYYYNNDTDKFYSLFKTAFYSSHAIGSCYATTCLRYVQSLPSITLDMFIMQLEEIPYKNFALKEIENASLLHDGILDSDCSTIMYFGDLIRELRTEQKLSQQIICQGLCSKSKLSKIENNYLQPDIFLAEALLQRLGLSERVFTFWGTNAENRFHEIKFKLMYYQHLKEKSIQDHLYDLEQVISLNNPLEMQYYLYVKTLCETDYNKKINLLFEALYITLPQFTFSHINDYRYTWMEFSLLNNICWSYFNSQTPHIGLRNFSFIIEYIKTNTSDVILLSNIFPPSVAFFIHALYMHKRYEELLDCNFLFNLPFMKKQIHFLGMCFFYYSQSLGECGHKTLIIRYAHYSCAINELIELPENAVALQNYLQTDFNITL